MAALRAACHPDRDAPRPPASPPRPVGRPSLACCVATTSDQQRAHRAEQVAEPLESSGTTPHGLLAPAADTVPQDARTASRAQMCGRVDGGWACAHGFLQCGQMAGSAPRPASAAVLWATSPAGVRRCIFGLFCCSGRARCRACACSTSARCPRVTADIGGGAAASRPWPRQWSRIRPSRARLTVTRAVVVSLFLHSAARRTCRWSPWRNARRRASTTR